MEDTYKYISETYQQLLDAEGFARDNLALMMQEIVQFSPSIAPEIAFDRIRKAYTAVTLCHEGSLSLKGDIINMEALIEDKEVTPPTRVASMIEDASIVYDMIGHHRAASTHLAAVANLERRRIYGGKK